MTTDAARFLEIGNGRAPGLGVTDAHGGVIEGVGTGTRRANDWRQAPIDHARPAIPARFRDVLCLTSNHTADHLVVVEVDPSSHVHENARGDDAAVDDLNHRRDTQPHTRHRREAVQGRDPRPRLWRLSSARHRLFVGGRDRTKLVEASLAQVVMVGRALADVSPAPQVVPVLCFLRGDWPLLGRPLDIDGVVVTWPSDLTSTVSAHADGAASHAMATARAIGQVFRPA